MAQRSFRSLICLFLALSLAACSGGPAAQVAAEARSEKPRESAPAAPESDQIALARGSTAFALDLYRALAPAAGVEEGNQFFSPYSISLALAMTYAGARGETARQMAEVLHFTLPPGQLHPAANAIDQALASRKDLPGGQGKDGEGFRLNIVNDLWGQKDYSFQADFLDVLASNYGAGLRLMDFTTNPDAARQRINTYIAEQTEQRIKDLIPTGAIDPNTRLVLTNAIYFNAAWLYPFEKALTQDQDFTLLDGSTLSVPMMALAGAENLGYLRGDGFQAAAIPYENNSLSMIVLLPDSGQYEAFQSSLDSARLEAILAEMQSTPVALRMPKFTFETEFQLGDTLQKMGMVDAFQPETADFSGMTGSRDLYIGSVIHKAFIGVDEAGTEAAAATAVIMTESSAPADEPVELTLDRPFLFLIYDQPTGTVLFLGSVTRPG